MTLVTKKYLKRKFPGNHAMHEVIDYIKNGSRINTIGTTIINNEIPGGYIDGVNTEFTFNNLPNPYTVRVYLNGVRQLPGTDYTLGTTSFTFADPPQPGDAIRVFYDIYISTLSIANEVPAGNIDGENTDYTLANVPGPGSLEVYLNGILQRNITDVVLSGQTITFVHAPETGDWILADYKISSALADRKYNVVPTGDINGVNTDFVLSQTPSAVYVYLNGVRQLEGTDFSLAVDTITFTSAPETGDWVLVDYNL